MLLTAVGREEIEEISRYLSRFDLLMPVSPKRKPYDRNDKIEPS